MDHTSEGLRLYEPRLHAMTASTYGDHDAGVCCLNFRARVLTMVGRTIEAVQISQAAIDQARDLAQPLSRATAYVFAAAVHQMRRDPIAAKKNAVAAVALAQDQNFRLMLAWAKGFEGWADVYLGRCEHGLFQIAEGIDAVRRIGTDQTLSHLFGIKADVCLFSKRIEEGLRAVEEGLEVVARTGERYYEAELWRLSAELKSVRKESSQEGMEREFIESIGIARSQSAQLFELRAAIGLGRIWFGEGRTSEAIGVVKQASRDIVRQLPDLDRMESRAFLFQCGEMRDDLYDNTENTALLH